MTTSDVKKRGRPKKQAAADGAKETVRIEQRLSPRKSLRTRVVFEDEFGEGFLYFLSRDVSTSGIFIETSLDLDPGMKVFLTFSIVDGERPIRVVAEVMRKLRQKRGPGRKKPISPGVGLRFVGLSGQDFEKINK